MAPADGGEGRPAPRLSTDPEDDLREATRAADFLKALSHEGRLLMLAHLCRRDHSVAELEQLTHSRQAAVSQQLARLRYERLVTARREGNQIVYALADERVRAAVAMLARHFALPGDERENPQS
jgi:DNA-binding transcriptional ArsR family regulator